MDEKGKILKQEKITICCQDVRRTSWALPPANKGRGRGKLQMGTSMYDWLDEVADDVILAHPGKVRAIAEARIKTDKIDSETLAHILRADLIPQAYTPLKDIRAIKRVLRQRMFFVRVSTPMGRIRPPIDTSLVGIKSGFAAVKSATKNTAYNNLKIGTSKDN